MKFIATLDGRPQSVEVTGERGQYRLTIGDQIWEVDAKLTAPGRYSLLIGGLSYVADVTEREGARVVGVGGETYVIEVDEATRHLRELNKLYLSTIQTLAMAIDAKDQVTHGHIRRVQHYAVELARALGVSDERTLKGIEAAALLHDTGKLAIPEHILNKPGKLTEA